MALSKIFKKTNAPDDLPDLAIDELKKELKKDYSEKEKIKEESPKVQEESPKEEPKEERQEEVQETENQEIEEPEKELNEEKVNLDKSFFNPLINELKKENFDPAKINSWYQKRFSDKSAIEEMKDYWEKQKNEVITETVEKEFKARINEKMNHLQKLEVEWQEIYIKLIEKEEEMKKEEKNIKKIMKDFSDVLKKKGNLKKVHKTK